MEKFKEYIDKKVKSQKPVGRGTEKIVYPHPEDSSKIVGVYYDKNGDYEFQKSPEYRGAEFYLSKILHLLFPKNFPDFHMTTSRPKTVIKGRINIAQERVSIDDPDVAAFCNQIKELKLSIDTAGSNLVRDKDNNLVYVDDVWPWSSPTEKLYDSDKLYQLIIQKLKNGERDDALKYLERLDDLFDKMKAKNKISREND